LMEVNSTGKGFDISYAARSIAILIAPPC